MLQRVKALILTFNESANIERTLKRLSWLNEVVVLDSYSDDKTVEIAKSFPNVTVIQRKFDDHPTQWEFGRQYLKDKTDWILSLDADYFLTDEIIESIISVTTQAVDNYSVWFARFKYSINGRVIKSGIYNPVAVLFKPDKHRYINDGHTQRLEIKTDFSFLEGFIIHDDRKSLRRWFISQINYAEIEAKHLTNKDKSTLSKQDKLRLSNKLTPFFVFIYCIIIRHGWSDGLYGWIYAFQRLTAEIMLQIYILDKKINS